MNKDYEFEGIDLQLFAEKKDEDDDEDELKTDGYTGEEEDKDTDKEDPDKEEDEDTDLDEDLEEDSDTEDPGDEDSKDKEKPTKKVDKVTAALIEQKRKNKELERKLQAIEDANAATAEKLANEQRVKDLIADGYGETQAKHMVESDANSAKLMLEIEKLKFEKLEKKYPGISTHTKEILDIQKKTNGALTVEEIYNAKFRTSSEYDIKTNAEAAAIHKQRQAQQKKGTDPSGDHVDKKVTKLSPSDERAYNHLKKQFPTLTKAQYLKNSKGGELEE